MENQEERLLRLEKRGEPATVEMNSKNCGRVEKLEKRERSTVAEAGTKTGTEKYELQVIGG